MLTSEELRHSLSEILSMLRREDRHPQLQVIMEAALTSGLPRVMQYALTEFDKLSTVEIMSIRIASESKAGA